MTNVITWPYVLRRGHSDDPSQGACAMDAINWLMHGKHGDHPECACPIISAFVIRGNDAMPDDVRQRLLGYLPRIASSRSSSHEAERLRILVLGAVRVFAPIALDAAGLKQQANKLRALPDDISYRVAAEAAEVAAVAAWEAAREAAARAAAWAAVVAEAAEAAARAAAWDAYFLVLDQCLEAGPQGEPWSADAVDHAAELYRVSGGLIAV